MKFRWIWWTLVIAWCIQIFYFTALPVYNDEHTRGFLTNILGDIFPKDSSSIGAIDYLIRKAAHVTVFGILAVLFKTALNKRRGLINLLGCLQLFTLRPMSGTRRMYQVEPPPFLM